MLDREVQNGTEGPALFSGIVAAAREFVQKEIAPIASRTDAQEEFPLELVRHMGRLGFLGIPYPEAYGGAGLDYAVYARVVREIAQVCASTAMTVVAHTTLTGHPLFAFGTEQQKGKYLCPLASGEKIGAFALTEPNAGSDISSIETRAVEQDGYYTLTGSKVFITNGNVADLVVVAAKTAPEKGLLGISLFVLERGMEGFVTSGRSERKLGMRGSDTAQLTFDHVKVPPENLIGKKNLGFKILHESLVCARLGMAAIAIGISEAARNHCLRYVKQRKQFGKYLYHFQSIKNMLADMDMNISAASLLLDRATALKEQGKSIIKEASEAKLFASETAMRVTRDAIQIFGAYGYSRDLPLERFFRDAKITEIGDGTSEIQRLIIADEMLKEKP